MNNTVYVVGHKNPDTDSICAAIGYANLKAKSGKKAVACRAGNINRESRFVLDYFGVFQPELLTDLYCRVKDMFNGAGALVSPETPVLEAWNRMRSAGIKTLHVTDENRHLLGLVTAGDLAEKYLTDVGDRNLINLRVSVNNLLATLGGELIAGSKETELDGQVVVWSGPEEGQGVPGCIALLGNEWDEQEQALKSGATCLILTGGAELCSELMAQVEKNQVVVIGVPMDLFTTARMILVSIPVKNIMLTRNILVFNDEDLLEDAKKVMLETRYRNYPVVDDENRVLGSISRYNLLNFNRKQVILVDHNELSQAVEGIEDAQIIEVIDHHRVGGVHSGEPILFRNEPLDATCTLVAKAYLEQEIEISKEIAGLLCAGILSDTMVFKSPTCTPKDREIAALLGSIADIDPYQFGLQMLKAGSSIIGLKPVEILSMDYKEFRVGQIDIGIGQVNLMGLDDLAVMKSDLLKEMETLRTDKKLEYVLLMVTDLISEATELLVVGRNPERIGEAFKTGITNQEIYLPGVLSRKKQVVPPLAKYFA